MSKQATVTCDACGQPIDPPPPEGGLYVTINDNIKIDVHNRACLTKWLENAGELT